MSRRTGTQIYTWKERALSLLLCAVMLLGMAPVLTPRASAAHWADTYLDQLVDWGVMRADQTGNPDAPVTRADFAAIINRAYGYTETGPIPFTDVAVTDWFYDDICIAYTAGYMAGTSDTTASPNEQLTREMAVCILGRNMMMKETPGESLAFSDGRDVSSWARGLVKTAVDNYIVSGYPDNTFGPQDAISKGQMAALVTQCVGQPLNRSGTYSLGGVFGNVTITSPDVTLRDTTISGDLFISGGVGLGGVKLENVKVLGRIIVSSSGESESGDASVVMRNVEAQEMLVDNMRNKTVTVRADGITEIANTIVRTSAYLEDNNTDDKGLMNISLEGSGGVRLDLAGRIKNVVNKTPGSTVLVAKGTVQKLTVDEAAVNSGVQLDRNTEVKELNLDVATNVTGQGDIKKLNINAAGSTVTMLPDDIYIRPGLNANVGGEVIDSAAADEISKEPHILSGYPVASDVAPTGFQGLFAGNKKGTIYWGVSSITDGSIDAEALIKPPSYGSLAVTGGSVATPSANTEVTAQVTGLTTGGNYYLSAVLVDSQSRRSPVKVISFTTPDSTVPAFAQGYPYMSLVTDTMAQAVVMPTKSCKMYYAVLPRNAQAPTPAELKAASVIGNLGYGVVDVVKNTERVINLSSRLEELKDYTAYFWLVDANGVNSSAVVAVQFTTVDMTPPEFVTHPHVSGQPQANAVPMSAALNENGTIFWAVVTSGEDYPKPDPNNPDSNEDGGRRAKLDSDYAKLQVSSGMNAIARGQTNATADTPVTFNVTGLQPETAYDLYYLAQDTAGNYTITVYKLQGGIHTLDTSGPIASQRFTEYSGMDDTKEPMNDTDIILEFNEIVCPESALGMDFLTMYQETIDMTVSQDERDKAKENFVTALRDCITMKQQIMGTGWQDVNVKGDDGVGENDWVIDYTTAVVTNEEGKMQIRFPGEASVGKDKAGLKLASGSTYRFELTRLTDNSTNRNKITPRTVLDNAESSAAGHNVPQFTVVFAEVFLAQISVSPEQYPLGIVESNKTVAEGGKKPNDYGNYKIDFSFRMIPNATSTVEDDKSYDLLLWTDKTMQYDLYYRVIDRATEKPVTNDRVKKDDPSSPFKYPMPHANDLTPDDHGWVMLGNSGDIYTDGKTLFRKSLHAWFNGCDQSSFPAVNTLDDTNTVYYEFAVSIRKLGTSGSAANPATWSGNVSYYVDVASSHSGLLYNLSLSNDEGRWDTFVENGLNRNGGYAIGKADNPDDPKRLAMTTPFTDSRQPVFANRAPIFKTAETSVSMQLTLDRPGTIYYAIAEADITGQELPDESDWVPAITTKIDVEAKGNVPAYTGDIRPSYIPDGGESAAAMGKVTVTQPDKGDIYDPTYWAGAIDCIVGSVEYRGVGTQPETVDNLKPNRTYYALFVITGSAREPSEIHIYKFKTSPVIKPKITINSTTSGVSLMTDINSNMEYLVYSTSDAAKIKLLTDSFNNPKYLAKADSLPNAYQRKMVPPDPPNGADGTPKPPVEKDFTVLDALQQYYVYQTASNPGGATQNPDAYFPVDGTGSYTYYNNYSVFDIYASEELKATVGNWIRSGGLPVGSSGVSWTEKSDAVIELTGGRPLSQALQKVRPGGIYVILAVSQNRNAEEDADPAAIDTFKAFSPVQITDPEPPELVDATNMGISRDKNGKYSGKLLLAFDKILWIGPKDTLKPLDDNNVGSVISANDITVSKVNNSADAETASIELTFNGEGPSATIQGGILKNEGGIPAVRQLTVTIEPRTTTTEANLQRTTFCVVVRWRTDENDQEGKEFELPIVLGNGATVSFGGNTPGTGGGTTP